jgi:hypothetical protein
MTHPTASNLTTLKSCQEILDETADYLFQQPEPSLIDVPGGASYCVYRRKDGNCCAVGYWIPAQAYRPEWDAGMGQNISELLKNETERPYLIAALALSGVDATRQQVIRLLRDLQLVHDHADIRTIRKRDHVLIQLCATRHEFLNVALAYFAACHGLNFTPRPRVST